MSGALYIVSVGPGSADLIVPRAKGAILASDHVVGYDLYLRWIAAWLEGKQVHTFPLGQEQARARFAITLSRAGRRVAVVSSGDAGVYAMASLVLEELREDEPFAIEVVPGITAANACAALLGAPLSHDFATLSLSDLLCPWEWIEDRAKRIAQADLCCVLYNVQSKTRTQGIYKIVEILLRYKDRDTVCGIVRNAYREDQRVEICALKDLMDLSFDMFTTVVVGNRFTRRKNQWIYTPRGYSGFGDRSTQNLPENAVWVFSGTSDGNRLAAFIAGRGYRVVVSAATRYGGTLAMKERSCLYVLSGKMGATVRERYFIDSRPCMVADATHPFATEISSQLVDLCRQHGIPYIRFERPEHSLDDQSYVCDNMPEAAEKAVKLGSRIFLATGSKDLAVFLSTSGAKDKEWFVRVTPQTDVIERVIELGIPIEHIVAMQGPFSREFNQALWKQWQIDCVVTKESGTAGGYKEKVDAAKELAIPVVVVRRPVLAYPRSSSSFEEIISYLVSVAGHSATASSQCSFTGVLQ